MPIDTVSNPIICNKESSKITHNLIPVEKVKSDRNDTGKAADHVRLELKLFDNSRIPVAEGARLRGASKIIGVDLNPNKSEIGKKFGITDFVNPAATGGRPISEVINDLTDGGADYCFECIGLASLMQDAFSSCREAWGKTVILGVEMHGSPLCVSSYEILKGKTVTGSLFGGIKPKIDIPLFARKYLDKELNLEGFITHQVKFKDINTAFSLLLEGKSLRCIIWMDD
ncbi:Alcohol dehydrogenase superfamily, zinc-type [Parasponia andersonii]|uniref:Alcohol dehydrogenase superfamily, zinc-type n=1 Tax=Parasponia andersonii TaxID=3476 RepID=A0A2P5A736_PARAD|nr:Alcohol dehydrogenase superfamily, zinc-type [Parasponia andersonii]